MSRGTGGSTKIAAIVGAPVAHSLSPLIQNAWIRAAGLDALYVALSPPRDGFGRLARGMRGGVMRGFNVTAPFKQEALEVADAASDRARRAGAANLLIFEKDGAIFADNTDGEGLLAAFAEQAPDFDPATATTVVHGAGGAARSAVMTFLEAGAPRVWIFNRNQARAETLARDAGRGARAGAPSEIEAALAQADAVINATTLGSDGGEGPQIPLAAAPRHAVVMDMVYRPLRTALLQQAMSLGLPSVDGLAMLIGQAGPSFQALFGAPPPAIGVRSLALAALEADP
jgi:shikimate dehydrogenase